DSEGYARNLKFARGGMGHKIQIAWYDTAVITDKGIQFMKEHMSTESSKSEGDISNLDGKPTIFISYNWGSSNFVNEIEESLIGKAEVHLDKEYIHAWGNITEFMRSIRRQDFAVLLISDAYLKSSACMYEVVQLMKDEGWIDKTMYIIMDDALGIYDPLKQAEYIQFWHNKCDELNQKIFELPPAATSKLNAVLNESNTILLRIGEFMAMVADVNNPPVDKSIMEILKRVMANPVPNVVSNAFISQPKFSSKHPVTLSSEATKLLLSACEDSSGIILMTRTFSGLNVSANGNEFVLSHDRRGEVRWEDAVCELQRDGFIKATNYKKEVFQVTSKGYDAADHLKSKLGDQ
ncbi:MAG TPA: toll/interleukin-1 receptor domain-containing protein, partial [Anaerovoracaceae bacterium]|nr:toll/interleukin-1 receptor domain-containing protein [Anaerovoracaceae bacterium]